MLIDINKYRRAHPKYPKLIIFKRGESPFYQGRAFVAGQLTTKSFKTEDLDRAERLAEGWYKKLLRSEDTTERTVDKLTTDPIMGELFVSYKMELSTDAQRAEAQKRWSPIADFWKSKAVTEITPQTFKTFFKWRRQHKNYRGQQLKNHTLHKDAILIRQILKYAVVEGHIPQLPLIPSAGQITANPRPWLTIQEFKDLERISLKRIHEAKDNPKLRRQREDLHDQMRFMVSSMARVDDTTIIRFRDCHVVKNKRGQKILMCEMSAKAHPRKAVTTPAAAEIYEHRLTAANNNMTALIFPEHHRDAFQALLQAANLYVDKNGFERNFKSLRATSIAFRILDEMASGRTPNLLMIARNAGTSVAMIDTFYARRLEAEAGKDILGAELEAFRPVDYENDPDFHQWDRETDAEADV